MCAASGAMSRAGIPLDVLEALIGELEEHPDLKWIIGEPVSSGLVLATDGGGVRLRLAPDVTLIADDMDRILGVLAAALADDEERLSRIVATAAPDALPRLELGAGLGGPAVPLDRMGRLIRWLREAEDLHVLLESCPTHALMVVAEDGALTLDSQIPGRADEGWRRQVCARLRELIARAMQIPMG